MTRAEYLRFVDVDAGKRKTRVVAVVSARSQAELGRIAWFGRWRQYVFHPGPDTVWNPDCLDEVALKVKSLTEEHRRLARERRP